MPTISFRGLERAVLAVFMLGYASSASASAKVDEVINAFFQKSSRIQELLVTNENQTFALVKDKEPSGKERNISFRFPANDFVQEVVLWRGKSFITEISKPGGKPTSAYLKTPDSGAYRQLGDGKSGKLSIIDAVPLYYMMFMQSKVFFREALWTYGIPDSTVRLVRLGESLFYRIGDRFNYLMLRAGTMRPETIATRVFLAGKAMKYEVKFTSWSPQAPLLPVASEHYLDGRLVKTMRSVSVKFKGAKALSQKKQTAYKK